MYVPQSPIPPSLPPGGPSPQPSNRVRPGPVGSARTRLRRGFGLGIGSAEGAPRLVGLGLFGIGRSCPGKGQGVSWEQEAEEPVCSRSQKSLCIIYKYNNLLVHNSKSNLLLNATDVDDTYCFQGEQHQLVKHT